MTNPTGTADRQPPGPLTPELEALYNHINKKGWAKDMRLDWLKAELPGYAAERLKGHQAAREYAEIVANRYLKKFHWRLPPNVNPDPNNPVVENEKSLSEAKKFVKGVVIERIKAAVYSWLESRSKQNQPLARPNSVNNKLLSKALQILIGKTAVHERARTVHQLWSSQNFDKHTEEFNSWRIGRAGERVTLVEMFCKEKVKSLPPAEQKSLEDAVEQEKEDLAKRREEDRLDLNNLETLPPEQVQEILDVHWAPWIGQILETVCTLLGVHGSVFLYGPEPRKRGQVNTIALHHTHNLDGQPINSFAEYRRILQSLTEWAGTCFSEETQRSRSLPPELLQLLTLTEADGESESEKDQQNSAKTTQPTSSNPKKARKRKAAESDTEHEVQETDEEVEGRATKKKKKLPTAMVSSAGQPPRRRNPRRGEQPPGSAPSSQQLPNSPPAPPPPTQSSIAASNTSSSSSPESMQFAEPVIDPQLLALSQPILPTVYPAFSPFASPNDPPAPANSTAYSPQNYPAFSPFTSPNDPPVPASANRQNVVYPPPSTSFSSPAIQSSSLLPTTSYVSPPVLEATMQPTEYCPRYHPNPAHHDKSAWPDWFKDTYLYLDDYKLGDSWQRLLGVFASYEAANRWQNVQGKNHSLPTKHRPKEVGYWIRCARGTNPDLSSQALPGFTDEWWSWWNGMQPTWRGSGSNGGALNRGSRGDWSELNKFGKNGLFSVLAALAWWGKAEADRDGANWVSACSDVEWVICSMLEWMETR